MFGVGDRFGRTKLDMLRDGHEKTETVDKHDVDGKDYRFVSAHDGWGNQTDMWWFHCGGVPADCLASQRGDAWSEYLFGCANIAASYGAVLEEILIHNGEQGPKAWVPDGFLELPGFLGLDDVSSGVLGFVVCHRIDHESGTGC